MFCKLFSAAPVISIKRPFPTRRSSGTGISSGSGKSTLVNSILKKTLAQRLNRNSDKPGKFKTISGVDYIDRILASLV